MQDAAPSSFTIQPPLAFSRALTHKVDLTHKGTDVHLVGNRADHIIGLFILFGAIALFTASSLLGLSEDTLHLLYFLSMGIGVCGAYYLCKRQTIVLSSENNSIVTHSSALVFYSNKIITNQEGFDTLIHRPVSKLKQNGREVYSHALLMRFKNGGEYTLVMGYDFGELQAQSLQISSALNIPIIEEK
jgi:hypothetical protein